jgi:DNA-binding XRE family transcriptional regulator
MIEESRMKPMTIERGGRVYALVPLEAWEKLSSGELGMPPLPAADARGRMDAVAFARATIARGIIRDRTAAGLSQAALARLAGIDPATLNRIEKAKVTPDETTVRKIDRALTAAMRRRNAAEVRRRTRPRVKPHTRVAAKK